MNGKIIETRLLVPAEREIAGRRLDEMDFCVIDTETTGGKAEDNRIIDVAVMRVRDGIILEKFQTLVNPRRPIPAWITMLTGIDDDMVRGAPTFDEIAGPLRIVLEKGVFAAHNAAFDYGFVRCEYDRLGQSFDRPSLCTLRMARLLCPELPSKSLGVLCEHLLIDVWDRHRAHGDAEATAYVLKGFLNALRTDHGIATWDDLQCFLEAGAVVLPAGVPPAALQALPEAAGVYRFLDVDGNIVFEGKSTNIRRRVRSHFLRSNRSPKAEWFRKIVRFIRVGEEKAGPVPGLRSNGYHSSRVSKPRSRAISITQEKSA